MRILGLLCLCVVETALGAGSASAADAVSPKPTCAFLCQDTSPLTAVVESKLLNIANANWLERSQIDAVLREQQLQKLLAADAEANALLRWGDC